MSSQIHSSHLQILIKTPINKPKPPQNKLQLRFQTKITTTSSSYNQEPSNPISTINTPNIYNVKFNTLGGCKLGISRYPDFEYNAQGGGGSGIGKKMAGVDFNGETSVDFDVKTLYIPPLTSGTTKFLGLPLPPFLKIVIVPEIFRGIINLESGKVDLKFTAKFLFSMGSIYKAPPLLVETVLTSEESKGVTKSGQGGRLDEHGRCKLVGVATVEPIDDFLMNSFLDLPSECLAILNATISFTKEEGLLKVIVLIPKAVNQIATTAKQLGRNVKNESQLCRYKHNVPNVFECGWTAERLSEELQEIVGDAEIILQEIRLSEINDGWGWGQM